MKYHGGKSRIANDLAKIMRGQNRDVLVSLFCGACNVESKIEGYNKIICNDNQQYLIALFKALQDGYSLPDIITEEQYHYVKKHKDENPALTGFVGFACSFGGRFFQGYARDRIGTNYALRGKKSLANKMKTLKDVEFMCLDYRDVELPEGCVIYADPPYENTKQYVGVKFDFKAFWNYARRTSDSHIMYISGLEAPDDFVSIWQKDVKRTLDVNKNNQFISTEKLFIHKNNLEIIQKNTCKII